MKVEDKKKTKLKLKKSVIFKSISLLTSFLSLLIFILFIKLGVLPLKYLLLLLFVLILIGIGLYYLMSRKNYKMRMIGTFISFLLIIVFAIALSFQNATLNFLENISILNIQTETYKIIIKKDSSYKDKNDLSGNKIAYVNDRKGVLKVLKELEQSIKFQGEIKKDSSDLIQSLQDGKVDAIIMEQEEVKIYSEISPQFKENTKIIDTIEVKVEQQSITKDVVITKEPFSIFVTGIDTYGDLSSVSRSDVNMVITINPLTHKMLLTSIPRDYYVQVAGTTGLKDKLTHAGLKGVETSVKTIENLLKTDINYYVKINFTSLVQIIDAIDGVDVDNPFEFTADYVEDTGAVYYVYKKGLIHLDGRYGLREGDVARARHQQQVIKGMVNKLTSGTILTRYTKILGSIEGNFATNLSLSNLTAFIQKQLDGNPSWTVENLVLGGADSSELTASMPDLYSSVMLPNEESVNEAIQKIKILKEEK